MSPILKWAVLLLTSIIQNDLREIEPAALVGIHWWGPRTQRAVPPPSVSHVTGDSQSWGQRAAAPWVLGMII